ncbi:MAG TPA: carboxy terminal-processing peptidase [Chryseolinea sp.]|nr:carboxy terminal-processing peptidase [Chryseolinea sp.]
MEKHIQPRSMDDIYSAWVFDNTIDELDPDRVCFTKEDINSLLVYRQKIDDELNGAGWSFLSQLTQLYKKNLQRYSSGIKEVGQQPVDFFSQAFLKEDSSWSNDMKILRKHWEHVFRFHLQKRLANLASRPGAKIEKDFLTKNESVARQQVLRALSRDADRILKHTNGFESYVASVFFQSMATAFDPHTSYFTSSQMQSFISSLSTQGFLFGFTLEENESGEVIISHLMPGGPAWNSGEIHKGDVLQAIRWEGKELQDLWGLDSEEVNDMLGEPDLFKIELTLKKADGTLKTVHLRKEKVTAEENVVKSFVLEGQKKIGFISLPDFYSNWGDADGSKCASDVAREIVKLKRENIEGLILDVRFNGGGSMAEAVAMAGIFIDAGPVGVMKNKNSEPFTLKDINRGTIYDGPLVIMVNSLSASASEFLAAALQDYNRALIVGARTYGKATAQQIMPADPSLKLDEKKSKLQPDDINAAGFAKVTTEKLYRITGRTAQQTGVIPDIELPDALQELPLRESTLPLSFAPDSIQKKVYFQPLALLPRSPLLEKSKHRINGQPQFSLLRNLGDRYANYKFNSDSVALKWPDFQKNNSMYTQLVKEIAAGIKTSTKVFKAELLTDAQFKAESDSYFDDFNNTWKKNLEEDIFVNETFLITCDLILHVTKK